MDCKQLSVCLGGGSGWIAKLDARNAGPYATRDLALQVAVAEALQLFATGQSVCVTVGDAKGDVSAAHCLCKRFQNLSHTRSL